MLHWQLSLLGPGDRLMLQVDLGSAGVADAYELTIALVTEDEMQAVDALCGIYFICRKEGAVYRVKAGVKVRCSLQRFRQI